MKPPLLGCTTSFLPSRSISRTSPAALAADDDRVLDDQRRSREADRELLRVHELGVPYRLAGLDIERDQAPVDGPDVDLAVPERDAAIVRRMRLHRDQIFVELRKI